MDNFDHKKTFRLAMLPLLIFNGPEHGSSLFPGMKRAGIHVKLKSSRFINLLLYFLKEKFFA